MKLTKKTYKSSVKVNLVLLCAAVVGQFIAGCGLRDPHFAIMGKSQGFLATTQSSNKVDILWVIDNSGTMGPKQQNLATSINSFMSKFVTKGMDYQIAVVTTDIRAVDPAHPTDPNFSGQAACIVANGARPKIITPADLNAVQDLASNANVGFFGSSDAHGLDAVQQALSAPNSTGCNAGFLRSDAFLAVIEFSDADDNTAATVNGLLTFLDGIRPPVSTASGASYRPYFVSAMVVEDVTRPACVALGPFSEKGIKFLDIASQTKGASASICDPDFSAGLLAVSEKILSATTALHLASVPDQSTINVLFDGNIVPADATNGFTFDAESNSIIFHGSYIPQSGTMITVNFTPIDIVR